MAIHETDLPDALELEFERLLSSSPSALRSPSNRVAVSEIIGQHPTYPSIVTLDVAGRPFKVSADVLNAESGFFQRQLSTSFNWTPQRDGTYFLDADPELFNHLLQFMRRPSVFPLFWSKDQGFDYDLYQRLQAEAKYFQIDRLHSWIEKKAYLNAIIIHTYQPRTMELKDVKHDTMSGCMSENWHYVPKVHKTYVCPRRIAVHYGNQDRCGKACRLYQGDCDTEYDEEDYLEVVSVRKEIVFDETVCQMG